MKVTVNLTLCMGHGQCEDAAPEVFHVTEEGLCQLLIESPPEAMRAQVADAAYRCPVEAISVED